MAMDPADAATILCNAVSVSVKFEGRRTRPGDLSRMELESIRQGRGRADGHSFARKYARLVAELKDLETETPTFGPELPALGLTASASRRTPSFQKTKDRTPESPKLANCVTLVPYVSTAAPSSVPPSDPAWPLEGLARMAHSYRAFLTTSVAWRSCCITAKLTIRAALYFPILLMWIFFLYAVMLLLHIIANPQVLVSLTFKLLSLAPAYGAWAAQQMLAQLQLELANALR